VGTKNKPDINDNISTSKATLLNVASISSLKKQSFSSSLKADFIKQLRTSLNYDKMQNDLFMESSSIFKLKKFKGLFREQMKFKPLSKDVFKYGKFGMRWKNSYILFLKSRFDNLYNPNKDSTTNLNVSMLNHRFNTSSNIKGIIENENKNLSLLFNKRLLWIPNQFYHLINTPYPKGKDFNTESFKKALLFQSKDSNPFNYSFNIRPKNAALFFPKPPLFLQVNRQGHLKPFTSFIDFPSLLIDFNKPDMDMSIYPNLSLNLKYENLKYEDKFTTLKNDTNALNFQNTLLLQSRAFQEYKNKQYKTLLFQSKAFINQSFGLPQKWSYSFNFKKSNLSLANVGNTESKQKSNSNLYQFYDKNQSITIVQNLDKSSLDNMFVNGRPHARISALNFKSGPSFSNFITFCTLVTFKEKKRKQIWLSSFKTGDSFIIHSANQILQSSQFANIKNDTKNNQIRNKENKIPIQYTNLEPKKFDLYKSYTSSNIISNSIKKQIKKLNCFVNKEELSLYLLSLNFKSSYRISSNLKNKICISIQKSKIENNKNSSNIQSINTNTKDSTNVKLNFEPKEKFFRKPYSERVRFSKVSKLHTKSTLPYNFTNAVNDFNLVTDINLKKGWVYLPKNPLKMASYHKTIIYPGQKNDLQLNASRPLYLECHSIRDIFSFDKQSLFGSFNSLDLLEKLTSSVNNGFLPQTDKLTTVSSLESFKLQNNTSEPKDFSKRNFQIKNVYSDNIDKFSSSRIIKNSKPRFILSTDLLSIQLEESKKELMSILQNKNELFLDTTLVQNPDRLGTFVQSPDGRPHARTSASFKKSNLDLMQEKRKILLDYFSQLILLQKQIQNQTSSLDAHKSTLSIDKNKQGFELNFSVNNSKSNINTNHIVLLIQPIEEYMQMNSKELKTYVHESTLKQDPVSKILHLMPPKEDGSVFNKKNNPSQAQGRWASHVRFPRYKTILVNPYYSSLVKKKLFQSYQYNKQKIASQSLGKFPTSDIKIYPMSSMSSMSSEKNFANETSLGNELISTSYYKGLNTQKRPINLSPFFISYNRPMGIDSIFKDQNVSLSYQPLSNFDSSGYPLLSSQLLSFFNFYLTKKTGISLPYKGPFARGSRWASHTPPSRDSCKVGGITQSENQSLFSQSLQAELIPRFVESPCFCLQNIYKFKNPILTFENLQRDFFSPSKSYPKRSQSIGRKNQPVSERRMLLNENKNKSLTLFSYNQANEMFLGVRPLAKTNVYSPFNGEVVLLNVTKGCMVLTSSNLISYYLMQPVNTTERGGGRRSTTREGAALTGLFQSKDLQSKFSNDTPRNIDFLSKEPYSERVGDIVKTSGTHLTPPKGEGSSLLRASNGNYPVNNILVKFLNMTDVKLDFDLACKINGGIMLADVGSTPNTINAQSNMAAASSPYSCRVGPLSDEGSLKGEGQSSQDAKVESSISSRIPEGGKGNYNRNQGVIANIPSKVLKISDLIGGKPYDLNLKIRLGDFCVYGDPVTTTSPDELSKGSPSGSSYGRAIQASGQLIHYNNQKITLRRSQPIFISSKGILHKFDNDFIDAKTPVITLSYQKLKTGDIIQGIPKVEQFFEARTTKRGRFFRDSLPYLLKSLFKRYSSKLPLDLAVRQSFYKIQQILVDGVHRVYKAQGVTISDKHLEVIVKQMTSKVRIIDGAQTGFFAGEILDLFFVEKINSFLMKKITYEPLVLGITKASLEVDSFLSAASFQQTTRVLSKAALFRKKDFLKGLKENVILGNLIPAGTGFLVYIDL
jgi:hypothetical protein